jgi:eukaryotic-like serine/threonine-protein kinase
MAAGPVRVGTFELVQPIGRGATGVVWQGLHRETGVTVAIKVLDRAARSHSAQPAGIPDPFRNEVRAMANLDHSGIVRIYDVGRVSARAAAARPADLEAGSPYVVMEYASGGTLATFVPSSWEADVRPLVVALLGALAHAHAHQLIHRDLKPGNVLRAGGDSRRPGWKLTDFGIATALERTVELSMAQELVGTLAYMSPEQIEGNWREYGPWTDLYSLGCLMYRLVGSVRPFGAAKGPALITAHLLDRPARLKSRLPVPDDLDAWVAKLVEKDPRDRFQSATEALRALGSLGAVVPGDLQPVPLGPRVGPDEDATAELEGPTDVVRGGSSRAGGRVPADWRPAEPASPPAAREVSAGLALVTLREPPLIGRQAERDLLWDRLGAVLARGRSEIVVIRGAPGVGRSRLARWIGETAHERVGLPFLLGEARHGEDPAQALGRPFRRLLRTVRLGKSERRERIERRIGAERPDLCDEIDEMLDPVEGRYGPEARYAAARQLVERVALQARGAVLVYDDAHLAPDLFGFARHLAQAQGIRPTPVLLVLVVGIREAQIEVRGALGDVLREIVVEPLPPDDHRRLVHAVAPLEPTLAASLAERTAGNPMHAIQVVRGWVKTRRLVHVGGGGLALDAPEVAVAPMPEVWRETLKRTLVDLPHPARVMLERAAALGTLVDEGHWQRVCDDPAGEWAQRGQLHFLPENGRIRAALRDRLIEEGVATDTDDGWRFLQELFRETVLTLAGSAGRLASHHRACARALLHRPDSRRFVERIGRHLLAGERPEQAIPHLFEAFRQRARTGGDRSALPVLGEIESAMVLSGVPETDVRWVELAVRRAEVLGRLGQMVEARRVAAEAERLARGGPWRRLRARAARVVGEVLLHQGDLRGADAALARAEGSVRENEDPRLLGQIHASRSQCAQGIGEVARARGHAVLAAKFLSEAGEQQGMAEAWAVLGERARRDGELSEAERCLDRACALQARVGTPLGEARALRALAEVVRARGELTAARERLGRAADRYREAGSPDVVLAVLGLARIDLQRRDWVEAHRQASLAASDVDPANQPGVELAVHAAMAAATAGMRDLVATELHLQRVRGRIDRSDADAAWCLELAAARSEAAGRGDLADEAHALAVLLRRDGPEAASG